LLFSRLVNVLFVLILPQSIRTMTIMNFPSHGRASSASAFPFVPFVVAVVCMHIKFN